MAERTTNIDFDRIFVDYQPKVRAFLARIVAQKDVDDLTQEALIKVNRSLYQYEGRSDLSSWIFRIATNVALDRLRKGKNDMVRVAMDCDTALDVEQMAHDIAFVENQSSVEQDAIREEMNTCLQDHLYLLPEETRIVLILNDIKDFSNQQVADILGISINAAKARLRRARAAFRDKLKQACTLYIDDQSNFCCDRKQFQQLLSTTTPSDQKSYKQ